MELTIDDIVSLAKRRGFVYPSSEIYGGFAAVYDYGPYGIALANAIKEQWWKHMVQYREDVVGLDAAIVMHPRTWDASGHTSGFADPMVEDKENHQRYRVDHLLEEVGVQADEKMSRDEIQQLFDTHEQAIREKHPEMGELTEVKQFNMLVKSNLGDFQDTGEDPVYLRGETAQGIYVNYKNVLNSTRMRVPFGIAQIGKVFRNEITARQFIFRTREFEQMEFQYFLHPDAEMSEYEKLKEARMQYYVDLGIKKENLQWHQHENLVFYASEAYDIEYRFPFGWKELEGLHARSGYDLNQHAEFSGESMEYTDPKTKEKFVPHIIEASVGVGRTMLMVLADAYTVEPTEKGERTVLKIHPTLAPVQVAVFPLLKNKPELVAKAKEIFDELKYHFRAEFDDHGNVGKRYRRQDEIGTPFGVTIDFDTLEDNAVTVRDRDTMQQERIPLASLEQYLRDRLK